MVAGRRQELAYPVRWYSIPNLWRYERPQRGRLREHWQLNVDIFGVSGLEAELEMIQIVDGILKSFGAKSKMYTVKLNSRILVNYLMNSVLGLVETAGQTLIRLIDRMHKMSEAEFYGQVELVMGPDKRDSNEYRLLLDFLKVTSVDSLAPELQQSDTVQRLKKLVDMLSDVSIHNVVFDPTLMRGFDYYTDIVFEVFDNNPDNNRSMFGGGRYDGLVGMFGVEPVPTVGFGMGDVTLQNFLESNNLIPNLRPETELYIAIIGEAQTKAHKVIKELREMHMNVFVDYTGRKVDKQLKSALKKSSKYIVFIGDNELKSEQYVLRNLDTGKEEAHSLQRIVSIIKDHRNS
jgi:histidyl-tRNA synthetase